MKLSFTLTFSGLYSHSGLTRLDEIFLAFLGQYSTELSEKLSAARRTPESFDAKAEATLLLEIAPVLEGFLIELFNLGGAYDKERQGHLNLAPLYECKRLFVQRQAIKKYSKAKAAAFDEKNLRQELAHYFGSDFSEITFASHVNRWSKASDTHQPQLEVALKYAAWACLSDAGIARHAHGVLFKSPKKIDFENLLSSHTAHSFRSRDGFKLTDEGCNLEYALDQANYCIFCHNQGKDSCSKGLREKDSSFKENPLGATLTGCPLEEKISEMNLLKADGYMLSALAIAVVDNPMLAATGHRICNDCMKSCIYQKQEPVNIPEVETRTLKDVLSLPYGFEIYSLLTRWNPLNIRKPTPKPASSHKVLVAGMGPAGFTLAHYLLNDGHTVIGIDGLKIEPLDLEFTPIKDISKLYESLDERVVAGFGGVAEYGITVRWDKNFLKLIRILLERRESFLMRGGVRLGSNITIESAFSMGFDHIALCMGAGKPTVLEVPNALARGVRAASDFLMALQLTGAARQNSIANLQVRMPIIVIGGGLTAIDTATEAMAYYPVQVEKFLQRLELVGKEEFLAKLTDEERQIANEFVSHAQEIREENAWQLQREDARTSSR